MSEFETRVLGRLDRIVMFLALLTGGFFGLIFSGGFAR